jgi:hypothetical protein
MMGSDEENDNFFYKNVLGKFFIEIKNLLKKLK